MKVKHFFVALALMLGASSAWADNTLSVKDVNITPNGKAIVDVEASFDKTDFVGYQFDIEMPAGIKVVDAKNGFSGKEHSCGFSNPGENLFRVIVSPPVKDDPDARVLPSGNFVLLQLTLEGDGTLAAGAEETAMFKVITFSDLNNTGTSMDDISFKVKVSDRLILDENSTTSIAAASSENVHVIRTINANEWSTILLPFALKKAQAEEIFGSDVQLCEFEGFEVVYPDDVDIPNSITINLKKFEMTSRKGMTAGKPYFIKVSTKVESFNVDGVALVATPTSVNVQDENDTPGAFVGTFTKAFIPEDGLFISGNKFYYSTGATAVQGFRAWLELGAVLDKETDFGSRIFLNFGDGTGISKVNAASSSDDKVFDLQGRRIEAPAKGIYIKGGKKVVIK